MKRNINFLPISDIFPPLSRAKDMSEVEYLKAFSTPRATRPLIDIVTPQPKTSKVFFATLNQPKPVAETTTTKKRIRRNRKIQG